MNNDKKQDTIRERQQREKEIILAQLRKMPVVQIALEKAGVGRTTYSRWRSEDEGFRKATEDAMDEGYSVMTDLSETQLFNLSKDKNFGAIKLVLRTHHPRYAEKLELSGRINIKDERLTPEQEAIVREALRMVAPSEQIANTYETDTESD